VTYCTDAEGCLSTGTACHACTVRGRLHRCSCYPQERMGVILEREDEMDCLVAGCNFLLRAIYHEAFSFAEDTPTYCTIHCAALSPFLHRKRIPCSLNTVQTPGCVPVRNGCTTFCLSDCFSCARAAEADVFPYLLVNIGSGVSMLKAHYYALAVLPLKLFLYSSVLVAIACRACQAHILCPISSLSEAGACAIYHLPFLCNQPCYAQTPAALLPAGGLGHEA